MFIVLIGPPDVAIGLPSDQETNRPIPSDAAVHNTFTCFSNAVDVSDNTYGYVQAGFISTEYVFSLFAVIDIAETEEETVAAMRVTASVKNKEAEVRFELKSNDDFIL